ncbi:MAG: hypothetical protein MHPSP_003788, partial [Paramarteilia canceri]
LNPLSRTSLVCLTCTNKQSEENNLKIDSQKKTTRNAAGVNFSSQGISPTKSASKTKILASMQATALGRKNSGKRGKKF